MSPFITLTPPWGQFPKWCAASWNLNRPRSSPDPRSQEAEQLKWLETGTKHQRGGAGVSISPCSGSSQVIWWILACTSTGWDYPTPPASVSWRLGIEYRSWRLSCVWGTLEFPASQTPQMVKEQLTYIVKNVMPINSITQNTWLTKTNSWRNNLSRALYLWKKLKAL